MSSANSVYASEASGRTNIQDPDRLTALRATGLLDTPPEQAFDRLTEIVCRLLHVPVSLVSLVDADRQFFKSAIGLPEPWHTLRETPLSHSFCQHVVTSEEPLTVTNARENPLVQDNLAIRDLNVIAYLGVPLRTPEGFVLGSLCAIDDKPRSWTEDHTAILVELSSLVMTEINLRYQLQQRKVAVKSLTRNAEALRQTNVRLEQFAAMAAHDLRSPLNTINGFVELAKHRVEESKDHETSRMLGIIEDAARQMVRQINTFLSESRKPISATPTNHRVNLKSVLDEVCRAIQIDIHRAKAHIVSEDLPTLTGNENHFYTLLLNLITNCIKYRGEEPLRISLTCTHEHEHYVIHVSDNGRGIDPASHDLIFDRHERSNNVGDVPGTGLGLARCKQIVEHYGGEIWVTSQEGQGATFSFRLPA